MPYLDIKANAHGSKTGTFTAKNLLQKEHLKNNCNYGLPGGVSFLISFEPNDKPRCLPLFDLPSIVCRRRARRSSSSGEESEAGPGGRPNGDEPLVQRKMFGEMGNGTNVVEILI